MTSGDFEALNVDEAAKIGSQRLVAYLKMLGCKPEKLTEVEMTEFMREWLRNFAKSARIAWANGDTK
jgi:hypothetical protein